MAYNLRTNEILLHGKFQPPNFNGVAVHRSQTEVQTKRGLSNICLDPTSFKKLETCTMYPKFLRGLTFVQLAVSIFVHVFLFLTLKLT